MYNKENYHIRKTRQIALSHLGVKDEIAARRLRIACDEIFSRGKNAKLMRALV